MFDQQTSLLRQAAQQWAWDEGRRQNVRSIKAIPLDILPEGPARQELIRRAEEGQGYYAYTAHRLDESITPTYYIGTPSTPDIPHHCRTTPALWRLHIEEGHELAYV